MATSSSGSIESTITSTTSQANDAQERLLNAFNLTPKDTAGIKKAAEGLGLSSPASQSLEAIQMEAKRQFEQKNQTVQLLSSIMDTINRTRQRIIDSIGR